MEGNNCFDTQRKKLFVVLLVLEAVSVGVLIGAKQFSNGIFSTIIRIVFLIAANFCLQPGFAIMYAVFALYCALYLVDPIGLFLVGHGEKKTLVQNILCIIAFVITLIASYLGYLYSKEINLESANASYQNYQDGYSQNSNPSFARPVNQPQNRQSSQQTNNQPSSSYGGTNYLYQNPFAADPSAPVRTTTRNQPERSSWKPFTGQAYSLA